MSKIEATVVADSTNPQNDRLTSVLVTMPRIILSEMNTHRMLSKNTSSSRAIPFEKMVEAVQNNPFIPMAWQKEHTGMQGNEYLTDRKHENAVYEWLKSRDYAVKQAKMMNNDGVTKQLCNRLLEPFMWTTMLITGSKEGWDNFFNLRCPQYHHEGSNTFYKSRRDYQNREFEDYQIPFDNDTATDLDWLSINKGQAEIHMMMLSEKIYDSMQESTPKQLKVGEWHCPFSDKITDDNILSFLKEDGDGSWGQKDYDEIRVKISTAMAARTSYTMVGDEKEINYERMVELHDRLIAQDPPHSSPMEHCARAMSDEEYYSSIKGSFLQEFEIDADGFIDISTHVNNSNSFGWCRNFKGFIPYRHLIENK